MSETLRLIEELDWQTHWKPHASEMRRMYNELNQWKSVFGHLGTADKCGNEWIRLQEENEALRVARDTMGNLWAKEKTNYNESLSLMKDSLSALKKFRHMMFEEAGCRWGEGDDVIRKLEERLK